MIKRIVWSVAGVLGLVLAPILLVAQTATVSPVRTFTCGAGEFANQLAGTGAFTCAVSSGTGINQLTGDVTAGPGSGSQATTLATVNSNVGSFTNSSVTVNAKGLVTAASSGSAAATGLWNQVLSATPTQASTGLSTWFNQGTATVADTAVGITLSIVGESNAENLHGISKAAPATPYTITALISANVYGNPTWCGIGWTDATKVQEIDLRYTGPTNFVSSWTNATTFSTDVAGTTPAMGNPIWFQLRDDGTNVLYKWSRDGATYFTKYTIAKASGFLGSGGYSNIIFVGNLKNGMSGLTGHCALLSYAEGS